MIYSQSYKMKIPVHKDIQEKYHNTVQSKFAYFDDRDTLRQCVEYWNKNKHGYVYYCTLQDRLNNKLINGFDKYLELQSDESLLYEGIPVHIFKDNTDRIYWIKTT